MNARESIPGMLRFGQGLSGKGIAIQIDTAPGTMPDKKLRSGGDIAKGPHGEDLPTRRATFEIKILAGRSGAKYSWQRVHPGPLGATPSAGDEGGTYDGLFAYERNGAVDVAEGSVVEASWSDVGPWLLFTSSAGSGGVWLRVTSATADANGDFPAVILDNNGDGTRSDGDTVRYRLIDGAGTVVVNGGIYWATLNGTITVGDDTFSLYDGVGNDTENVTDCQPIEGVPTDGYRVWKVPHPWSVGSFIAGSPP